MSIDLANLNRVKATSFPTITDNSADNTIETLITVASRAIELWCQRIFSVNSYDEIYDTDGNGSIFLNNFPVLTLTRMAMTQTTVMACKCSDTVTNSRAYVMTTQISQQEVPTPTTGLVLTRVAGGQTITDATLLWQNYPTIQLLANAVNAVGFAWSAQVTSNFGNWASADITPIRGAQNALNNLANLQAHTTDLNDYDLTAETGEIRFSGTFTQLFGTGWLPMGVIGTGDLYPGVNLPRGSRNVRVQYTAGFNIIPDTVQQACAEWTAHLYQNYKYAGNIQSETLADYSVTRQIVRDIPPNVRPLLMPFRDRKI